MSSCCFVAVLTCFESGCSGEGVPDILMLLIQLTQKMMEDKLMYISEVQVALLLLLQEFAMEAHMN